MRCCKSFKAAYVAALFILDTSIAHSDPQPPPEGSLNGIWWIPITSALIGSLSALAAVFLKDFLLQRLNERRSKSARHQEIFRNYAAPLAATTEKLLWRFKEIFMDERHHFLKSATLPLVFNEYKRKSTLYRIACLLGWIRAINLELSSLPRGASGLLTPVSNAIGNVQSALADGPYVELHRLEQMCVVWGLDLSLVDLARRKSLAMQFEVKLYGLAGDTLKHDSNHLKKFETQQKLEICRILSTYLCSELRRAPISEEIIAETLNRAIAGLSYREALIYRDWQDAIGDAMLDLDPDSVRRFKVIGYERFEELLLKQSLWLEVFRDSIVDIDFDLIDPNDFRAKQLRDLASGVANILISLSNTKNQDLVGKPVLEVAQKLALQG